jgi:hypothetical protein
MIDVSMSISLSLSRNSTRTGSLSAQAVPKNPWVALIISKSEHVIEMEKTRVAKVTI